MYRPIKYSAPAAAAAAIALCTWLTACSSPDLYLDNRDSVSLGAGDAVAANKAIQTIDPWPPESGDRNLSYNGQKMQAAIERYRTDKVIQPADPDNFMSNNGSGQTINQTTVNTGGASSSTGASVQ